MQETHPLYAALKAAGLNQHLLSEALSISEAGAKSWLHTIDESSYSLNEWAESLVEFEGWIQKNQRAMSLEHMLEYLSCCSESARGGVTLPLPFLLSEFLRTNGVEPRK